MRSSSQSSQRKVRFDTSQKSLGNNLYSSIESKDTKELSSQRVKESPVKSVLKQSRGNVDVGSASRFVQPRKSQSSMTLNENLKDQTKRTKEML